MIGNKYTDLESQEILDSEIVILKLEFRDAFINTNDPFNRPDIKEKLHKLCDKINEKLERELFKEITKE